MKPGYRTTEFWFTLVSFIFSGLYLIGLIGDPSQKEELISTVSHAVESCILIGGQFMILYKYINGRNKQKLIHDRTLDDSIITTEDLTDDQSRTDNKRSRKTSKPSKRKPGNSKKTSGK
jgi:hypothetical protein